MAGARGVGTNGACRREGSHVPARDRRRRDLPQERPRDGVDTATRSLTATAAQPLPQLLFAGPLSRREASDGVHRNIKTCRGGVGMGVVKSDLRSNLADDTGA